MSTLAKNQVRLEDVYRWYKTRTDEPVEYKVHKLILDTWGRKVNEYLLQGKDVKLPQGLSTLGVRKKEQTTYVDYQASKIARKLVIKPNSHSGYYGARVYWRRHYTAISSGGWEFKPSRELARALAKVMQIPRGHMRFVKRAMVTRDLVSSKSTYNKKIHKI